MEEGGVSILRHTIWPALQPYIRLEIYGRDGGPDKPRHRIEVLTPPDDLRRQFLAAEMPCVHCGSSIHPIRARAGHQHLYFAATCSLDVRYSCARSREARDEYSAIKAAMAPPPPPHPSLF
jgi:hypothetical protein